MTMEINVKDEMVMKLLHYFITEKNYNPETNKVIESKLSLYQHHIN